MNKETINLLGMKNNIARLTSTGRKILTPELIAFARQNHYMHDCIIRRHDKENESDIIENVNNSHEDGKIKEQGIGNIDGSTVTGNNVTNNQENRVDMNSGITGITGTGHTITINQCPKEIIEILSKMIEITKINGL